MVLSPPEKREDQKWLEEKFRQLKEEHAGLMRESRDYAAQECFEKELRASLEEEKDEIHPKIQPLPSTQRDEGDFFTVRERAVRLFSIQLHERYLTKPTEELHKLSQSIELKAFNSSRVKRNYIGEVCYRLTSMKEKHLAIRLLEIRTDLRNVRRILNGEHPSPGFIRFSSRPQGPPQRRKIEKPSPMDEQESPPAEEPRKEKGSFTERNEKSGISVGRNGEGKRDPQRPRVTVKIKPRPKPAGRRNEPLLKQAVPQLKGYTSITKDEVQEVHVDEERSKGKGEGPKKKQPLSILEGATILKTTWDPIVTFTKKYSREFNILYGLICATWELEKVGLKRKKEYHKLFKSAFYLFSQSAPFGDMLKFEGVVPVIEDRLNKMFAKYRNVIEGRVDGVSGLSAKVKARVLKALDTCCGKDGKK